MEKIKEWVVYNCVKILKILFPKKFLSFIFKFYFYIEKFTRKGNFKNWYQIFGAQK